MHTSTNSSEHINLSVSKLNTTNFSYTIFYYISVFLFQFDNLNVSRHPWTILINQRFFFFFFFFDTVELYVYHFQTIWMPPVLIGFIWVDYLILKESFCVLKFESRSEISLLRLLVSCSIYYPMPLFFFCIFDIKKQSKYRLVI